MKTRTERVYVRVNTEFDTSGYMKPRTITWTDGRVFRIDAVKDFRPADPHRSNSSSSCYTVVICGRNKKLFFEKTDPKFGCMLGRWYVECANHA